MDVITRRGPTLQRAPTLRYYVHLLVQSARGTGSVKIWKTRHKIFVDMRIFFTVCACCKWPRCIDPQPALVQYVTYFPFTVIAATSRLRMQRTPERRLSDGCVRAQAFTAIFATEAALKIMALGLFRYLKDRWNCFDLFVVSLSLIELGLSGNKAFSILRSFRLVRYNIHVSIGLTATSTSGLLDA